MFLPISRYLFLNWSKSWKRQPQGIQIVWIQFRRDKVRESITLKKTTFFPLFHFLVFKFEKHSLLLSPIDPLTLFNFQHILEGSLTLQGQLNKHKHPLRHNRQSKNTKTKKITNESFRSPSPSTLQLPFWMNNKPLPFLERSHPHQLGELLRQPALPFSIFNGWLLGW